MRDCRVYVFGCTFYKVSNRLPGLFDCFQSSQHVSRLRDPSTPFFYLWLVSQRLPPRGKMLSEQLEWLYAKYNDTDPRTSRLFLMSESWPVITIVATYIYFCGSAGQEYMKNKQPYTLRKTLIVYNCIQVLLSIYVFKEALMMGWWYDFSYTCQPVDYSERPSAMLVARVSHFYFLCKLTELLDTVFFVLRKKERQITFLHLYHHASMPLYIWIGVRYYAGVSHLTFMGLLNSFVHIFMYSYYMLAAFGPEMQKSLMAWKKYITIMQIVQFLVVGLHTVQVFVIDCDVPKFPAALMVLNSILFCYLFTSFYIANYVKSSTNEVESRSLSRHTLTSRKSD
ncbi:very long chain fatty acid elongase 7-like isoform X1 [Neodiprion pinetum]